MIATVMMATMIVLADNIRMLVIMTSTTVTAMIVMTGVIIQNTVTMATGIM
jgi:hypothetical protein